MSKESKKSKESREDEVRIYQQEIGILRGRINKIQLKINQLRDW